MALRKVNTKYGTVIGIPGNDPRITVFKGIPYAKAPKGKLRLMAPQKPDPWEGELLCDKWSDSPVQDIGRYTTPGVAFSEDCLKLNIWTPAESPDEKLPVMIFFYGGGFNRGDSCYKSYDGEAINHRGVIHVNVNYRVSVLGFLALPELSERAEYKVSGNYGLLDQIASIKWVKENISAFGGDPDNITIFGQSAGGSSCRMLATSPLAKGLFRHTIIMSGGRVCEDIRTMEEYQDICHRIMEHLGWTVDDILNREAFEVQNNMYRAAAEVLAGMGIKEVFFYRPCVDGYVLPDKDTSAGLFDGNLDVIMGSVYGDGSVFGGKINGNFENPYDIIRTVAFAPPIAHALRAIRQGSKPIYTYFIERARPSSGSPMPHGAEIPYFFGTLDRFGDAWTDFDRKFSEVMLDYITNFAKTGNPNREGLPYWPTYTAETPVSLNVTDSEILVHNLINSEDSAYVLDCMIENKEITRK